MPYAKQDMSHDELLQCGLQAKPTLDAVQLNETECGVVGDVGPSWVGRLFYKWCPQNRDCTNRQTYAGSIISIKRPDALDGVYHLLDVFKVKYADGESEDMKEDKNPTLVVYI